MKGKNLQPRILYPARLSFRFDGEIKSFPDKQKLSRQRKRRTQRHNQREAEEWREEVRPAEKGKGKRPGKKNEDRQTDGLEKKKTAVRSGSAWAGRTQVRGGQGREGSRLIQSQSWTCSSFTALGGQMSVCDL